MTRSSRSNQEGVQKYKDSPASNMLGSSPPGPWLYRSLSPALMRPPVILEVVSTNVVLRFDFSGQNLQTEEQIKFKSVEMQSARYSQTFYWPALTGMAHHGTSWVIMA